MSLSKRAARSQINALDERIAELLIQRARIADGIVAERVASGGGLRDPARELAIKGALARRATSPEDAALLDAVYGVILANAPCRASSSEAPKTAPVQVGGASIGAGELELIAGPCAVEEKDRLRAIADAASKAGAKLLRGGAYKPRTSPRAFQGLGEPGLRMLREVADEFGLAVVTEVMEPSQVPLVAEHADMLQVGSRSMHCPPLLRAVGRSGLPVLLKRGMAATLEELVCAQDYVRDAGGEHVVLCLRGIRTPSDSSRFTLDVAAIAKLRELTTAPIVVDPSHAAGARDLVTPLALAGVAAGADGLLVEVHPAPELALCDGPQALLPEDLHALMSYARAIGALLRMKPASCPRPRGALA